MIEAPPAIKIHKPKFKPEIDFRVQAEVSVEKSTIVHCRLSGDYEFPTAIRTTAIGRNCYMLTILLLTRTGK
jgi:hypothetical protein